MRLIGSSAVPIQRRSWARSTARRRSCSSRREARSPPAGRPGGHLEPLRIVEEQLADGAAAAGLFETMSAPFVDRRTDEGPYAAWLAAAGSAPAPLSLANPLDAARRDLRATLLP